MRRQISRGDVSLLILAAAGPKHGPQATLGDQRLDGGWRDVEHAGLRVERGGRHRGGRTEMADDKADLRIGEPLRDLGSVLWIIAVVARHDARRSTEEAAGRVGIRHRLLDAKADLVSEDGIGPA